MEKWHPGWIAGHPAKTVTANYLSELRLGDEFTLNGYEKDGSFYYEGAADKPKFLIKVT